MTQNPKITTWRPDFAPGDEAKFDTLARFVDVPAVAFLSRPGADYYRLEDKDLPQPAPYAQAVSLEIELLGLQEASAGLDDPPAQRLRALRYTSNRGVTGVFGLRGAQQGSPFLSRGRVIFFGFVYNPDPGSEGIAVHRTVALGMRRERRRPGEPEGWGTFGFLREIDTFGRGFPELDGSDEDFQIFSSPAAYQDPAAPKGPFLFHDTILSAGALTDVA